MKISLEILKKANVLPRLRLAEKLPGGGTKGTGPHKVRILEDSSGKGVDPRTGAERYEVTYIVEEDGIKKKYVVPMQSKKNEKEPHYLVQRLAEIAEGEEIILEFKRSGPIAYIDVQRLSSLKAGEEEEVDVFEGVGDEKSY